VEQGKYDIGEIVCMNMNIGGGVEWQCEIDLLIKKNLKDCEKQHE
jgi:hypothetical protein